MGFVDLLASFVKSPASIYSSICEKVLPSPDTRKRPREDSSNAEISEFQPTASRQKLARDGLLAAERRTIDLLPRHGNDTAAQTFYRPLHNAQQPQTASLLHPQVIPGRGLQYSQTQRLLAAHEAGLQGKTTPAPGGLPADKSFSRAATSLLYRSVTPRRHGPYSSFRTSNLAPPTVNRPLVSQKLMTPEFICSIICRWW